MAEAKVQGSMVQVGAIDAYLVGPSSEGRRPGVVVIHEAYGLNDNIRGIADRLAAEGYRALAVDLFSHGGNRRLCMVRVMLSGLTNPQRSFSLEDLDQAVAWLQARPEVEPQRIGVIGFCLGGTFALAMAVHNEALGAASAFYGLTPRPIERLLDACPIVASYGADDRLFARQGRKLAAALREYEIPHNVKIYAGAGHSFFNDTGRAYRPEAAADAWQRTLAFFASHLGGRREPEAG